MKWWSGWFTPTFRSIFARPRFPFVNHQNLISRGKTALRVGYLKCISRYPKTETAVSYGSDNDCRERASLYAHTRARAMCQLCQKQRAEVTTEHQRP